MLSKTKCRLGANREQVLETMTPSTSILEAKKNKKKRKLNSKKL